MIDLKKFGIGKVPKNKLTFGKLKVARGWDIPVAVLQGSPG